MELVAPAELEDGTAPLLGTVDVALDDAAMTEDDGAVAEDDATMTEDDASA